MGGAFSRSFQSQSTPRLFHIFIPETKIPWKCAPCSRSLARTGPASCRATPRVGPNVFRQIHPPALDSRLPSPSSSFSSPPPLLRLQPPTLPATPTTRRDHVSARVDANGRISLSFSEPDCMVQVLPRLALLSGSQKNKQRPFISTRWEAYSTHSALHHAVR